MKTLNGDRNGSDTLVFGIAAGGIVVGVGNATVGN